MNTSNYFVSALPAGAIVNAVGSRAAGVGLFAAALFLAGCVDNGELGPNDASGTLRVSVSADSVDDTIEENVTEVWVRIDSVQAFHESEGWIEISSDRLDLNLMDNEDFVSIARGTVWTGAFERIYIGVVDSWIVVDGSEEDLEFSANFQATDPFPNGMYVSESLFVIEDATTTLSVSWDLSENLSVSGGGVWSLGSNATAVVDIVD